MDVRAELKSYSDIRKHVTPSAFTQAMNYISWHNRLTFTHLLLPWEALVVTMAFEQKTLDGMLYTGIKAFLDQTRENQPKTIEDCRDRANALLQHLYPSN